MKGARVSYSLPYNNGIAHRFGVNKLILDSTSSNLFSAGRDGTVKCWSTKEKINQIPKNQFSIQAHIDWVNDIILTKDEKTCML
jgi:WD repeat-containing protein 48